MKFQATIQQAGKTATGMEVPPDVVEALGSGKRPAVRVTVAGHTYRSSVAPMRGRFMLPLSAENRERAGVAAGDEVEVEVELDTETREVAVPDDLAKALSADRRAREFFEGLPYSQKQWYVLPIEQAKKPETRERRIAKAVDMLRDGRKR
jgi:bifunctional DNA-binding transcriptional regulator/antitoxin component of YhaV-PrlF toxin-antitoxin module